jgi:hypothetical protein
MDLIHLLAYHPQYQRFLKRALPRIVDRELREEIEGCLDLPVGDGYWQP